MTFMSTTDQSPAGVPGPLGPLRMTPGRWVALAVAVPVALALIGWTGFSLISSLARGSYPFSYRVPVNNGQVAVNVNAGDITLRAASGSGAARLTGIVQYGLVRPAISEVTTSAGTNVGVNCDGITSTNCDVNATLDIPAKTGVTLWSNGGDITASGFSSGMTLLARGGNVAASDLSGNLRLDTGGGDLTGTGLTGAIQVSTEGGNVDASNVSGTGTMRFDTGGGDLNGYGITGKLQLDTEGGNVGTSGMTSQQVVVQSGGGDVTLAFAQVPQSLQITAQGGNVTVILPPGDAKYAVATPGTEGGTVSYPSSLVNSNSPDTITIDSGGGDITITQG
jgi:Putative adhesin